MIPRMERGSLMNPIDFRGRDLLGIEDLTADEIRYIFDAVPPFKEISASIGSDRDEPCPYPPDGWQQADQLVAFARLADGQDDVILVRDPDVPVRAQG